MGLISNILGIVYVVCAIGASVYGFNSLVIGVLYLLTKWRRPKENPVHEPQDWPRVTVQLPVFNEKYMLERLLQAVAGLDYPADRLQVQLLDDSTDDTATLSARLAEMYHANGLDIECLHRSVRDGYKAGALTEGMQTATGELLAIFDADFLPPRDWLRKSVLPFQDPRVGCVQTRFGYTNRTLNLLTRVQALMFDTHFLVEHNARARTGLFENFNGSAGLWRRACIEDVGGWQTDTLTEDLDLSYRAQMCGWRIAYLPDLVVPGELPARIESLKKQQFRWAKGSMQVTRKLAGPLLTNARIPWYQRLEGFLHITGHMVQLFMELILLLTLPVGLLAPGYFRVLAFTAVAALGPPLLCVLAGGRDSPSLIKRLLTLPFLTLTGLGLSLDCSIAVIQGLARMGGSFVRTPKFNLTDAQKTSAAMDHTEGQHIDPVIYGEIALSLYALVTIYFLSPRLGWAIVPWMASLWLAHFAVAAGTLFEHWQAQARSQSSSGKHRRGVKEHYPVD